MVSWLEIARVLAKESAYRSARQTQSVRTWSFWRGGGSILKANLFPAILFTGLSCALGFGILEIASSSLVALPLFFGLMGAMQLMISLFGISSSTSIMTSQGLLEPLTYRPIEESTLRKAIMAANLVYWGIGASVLTVVPASVILSMGLATPYPIVAGAAMGLTMLVLAYGAGMFVASLAPSVRTSPKLRFLATLAWILLLLVGYLPSLMNSIFGSAAPAAMPDLGPLAELIPPFNFGFLATGNLSLVALTSCAMTAALSLIILRFSSNRLWLSLVQGATASVGPERALLGGRQRWAVRSYWTVLGLSVKDFKLLIRSPQRLATFIAYPVIFVIPFLVTALQLGGGSPDLVSLPLRVVSAVVPAMGVLLGVISEQLFYIEGEGARDLYRLPVTRRELALSKALSSFVGLLPMGMVACGLVSYIAGIQSGLIAFVLLEVNLAASLMICSASTMSSLPREASGWSERSIGTSRVLIRFALVVGGIVLAGIFAFLAIATPIGELAMVGLSVILAAIAMTMYRRLRDVPLGF